MQCLVGGLFVACLHIHPFAFVPFWLVPTHKSIFDLVDPWTLLVGFFPFVFFTHPPIPWVAMPTMINTMTLLLVVLHFLRASVASAPTDDDYRTGSILAIEDICMCLHAIIDRVGAPIAVPLHSLVCLFKSIGNFGDGVVPRMWAVHSLWDSHAGHTTQAYNLETTSMGPAQTLDLASLRRLTALQSLVWRLLWSAVAPRQSWHSEWLSVDSRVYRRHLWHAHSTT